MLTESIQLLAQYNVNVCVCCFHNRLSTGFQVKAHMSIVVEDKKRECVFTLSDHENGLCQYWPSEHFEPTWLWHFGLCLFTNAVIFLLFRVTFCQQFYINQVNISLINVSMLTTSILVFYFKAGCPFLYWILVCHLHLYVDQVNTIIGQVQFQCLVQNQFSQSSLARKL